MKRVANLYRVSTKKQVDLVKDDIPMQRIACREFAERQGWTVVIEKEEKGISGFKVSASKRDAIQELKDSALKGEFDVLLVFMFDRLGRIENETPFILEWFTEHGIEVWSVNEGQQKIETHSDKLMNYIRFWQASGESEKTAIRVRTRLQQMTAEGVYTGGPVPFGYAVTGQDGALDVYAFEKQLKTLNDIMDETMELAANSSGDGKRFQQEIRSLSEQMVVIREQLEIAKERIASNEKINSEIENIKEYLSSSDICFTEYSDVTVRRLVEYIRVMKDNSIIIVLKGGIQIREPIETNN